jgi:D-alanyl-D-alanine carboxypeptidase (penicillin-binding protein 5/6)
MNENIEGLSKIDIFDLTVVNTNLYVQEFISRMKERAAELKLHSTRFSNPHGLQNALNISSAKDIALLSAEASKNELFKVIMSTVYHRYDVFEDESLRKKKQKKWWNTNKLLTKDWEGVKTGQTGSAGSCLSSLKQGVFIVVLNSSNSETRFSDTERIYNWYIDQKIPSLEVKRSEVSLPQRRTKTQFRYL